MVIHDVHSVHVSMLPQSPVASSSPDPSHDLKSGPPYCEVMRSRSILLSPSTDCLLCPIASKTSPYPVGTFDRMCVCVCVCVCLWCVYSCKYNTSVCWCQLSCMLDHCDVFMTAHKVGCGGGRVWEGSKYIPSAKGGSLSKLHVISHKCIFL